MSSKEHDVVAKSLNEVARPAQNEAPRSWSTSTSEEPNCCSGLVELRYGRGADVVPAACTRACGGAEGNGWSRLER